MLAVLVTAVVTYLVIVVLNLDFINIGNFLVEGLIAVIIGATAGLIVPCQAIRDLKTEVDVRGITYPPK